MVLSKRQFTLAATALGSSLAFIDVTAVIVALPSVEQELNLGLSGQQWVFLSYSLALAALYLVAGSLGDRLGHRSVFIKGIIGFALASALAGLAPNGTWLIVARALQGISGAFVTTNSLAWLRSVYDEQAGRGVGLWTSLTGVSTILAPPLGGALTQFLSWRYIFYINLPLAALVIYWANRAAADEAQEQEPRQIDFYGSLLIAVSFSFLIYYLVQGAKIGFARLWWSLLVGLSALLVFIISQLKLKHPLIPLMIFKIRNLAFANLETFLIYGALSGIFVYLTLYLQFLGLSPLQSSLFLIPISVVLILLAPYFGSRADRLGARTLLCIGPLLIGSGALLFSFISSRENVWWMGTIGLTLFSFGLAMLVAPITAEALKSAPKAWAGVASGINNTVSRLGGLITVAVVGMIISIAFISASGNKQAVPLALDQQDAALRAASQHGYQVGMWVVAGLAYVSAAVGWFGITNKQD